MGGRRSNRLANQAPEFFGIAGEGLDGEYFQKSRPAAQWLDLDSDADALRAAAHQLAQQQPELVEVSNMADALEQVCAQEEAGEEQEAESAVELLDEQVPQEPGPLTAPLGLGQQTQEQETQVLQEPGLTPPLLDLTPRS